MHCTRVNLYISCITLFYIISIFLFYQSHTHEMTISNEFVPILIRSTESAIHKLGSHSNSDWVKYIDIYGLCGGGVADYRSDQV